ncbi:MAG: hypothetical protein H6Q14_1481 [Bacteroidetes bacterium]|nr:hypothetical protein [Bacteroidota bacterium]
MRLKLILLTFLSFVGMAMMAQNNYPAQWKQVEKFQKDNLPKSALGMVETILKQSLANKNHQQAIKAMIYRSSFKQEIDDTTKPELIADFSSLLNGKTSPVEKALIHSLLAELYQQYYDQESWKINQRTPITGYVPNDMAEWSKNIFQDKIQKELQESLSDTSALLNAKTEAFSTIVILGKDSRKLYPTMYDFLLSRALDNLGGFDSREELSSELKKRSLALADLAKPGEEFAKLNLGDAKASFTVQSLKLYQDFLSSLKSRNLTNSLLLLELRRINFVADKSAEFARKYKLDALLTLEKANESSPFVLEVIDNLADYYTASGGDLTKRYEWLKKGIALYPNNERVNNLKNKLAEMEQPMANFSGKNAFYPNEKKTIDLSYKNLDKVILSIYSYSTNGTAVKVKEYPVNLHPKTTYKLENEKINLEITAVGNYYAKLDFDKKYDRNDDENRKYNFSVTNLVSVNKKVDDSHYSVFVTERESGKPLQNASVSTYVRNDKDQKTLTETFKTDENGLVRFSIKGKKNNTSYYYKISSGKDAPEIFTPLNNYYYFRKTINTAAVDSKKVEQVTLLTDRSIYRPGQTVYFKLIATEGANGENAVLADKPYTLKLYDVNRQEVAKKTLATNEFGSLAGEFVLPQGLLDGQFSITAEEKAYAFFHVEEYKRPTFQVTFDKVDKTYKFGQQITLKGHAENFSGVKLQDADVNYTVTRQRMNLWRWFGASSNESQIDEQTVKTADDGSFSVNFIPQKEDEDEGRGFFPRAYLFTVKATVTDLNGETQSQGYYIRVADVSMILAVDLEGKYDKDAGKAINVKATNLDGNEIPAKGTYAIYTLDENDSIASPVLKGDFASGRQTALEQQFKKLASGKYRIILKANDSNGQEVEGQGDFVLYSVSDKRPPYKTNNWLIQKNTQIAPGKPVEVVVGISDKDVYVLYELTKGYDVLERKVVKLSDENRLFSLPYKKEYEENVGMSFTFIRNGELTQHQVQVTKAEEPKDLQVKLDVFRDKLRPGQKEEWRITVKDAKGQPSVSELLASMYDQSLDKINPMSPWALSLSQKQSGILAPLYRLDNSFGLAHSYFNFNAKYLNVKEWSFDRFNWFDNYGNTLKFTPPVMIRGAATMARSMKSEDALNEVAVVGYGVQKKEMVAQDKNIANDKSEANNQSAPQIRTNFNETAFFLPQLRTNEKGETVISFTVPESNTTWKFRALAYDKNLNSGQLEASVVTRKELMVTPNLPRFVRTGDKTSVSTKISNLSDNAVSGKVRVEFFNPLTYEVVNLGMENAVQSFDLAKDASSSASWMFVVPKDFDVLGCRIVAESASFSDGEQHVIPVLPDKMLVTESLPLYIRGGQTKQFSFDHLLKNSSSTLSTKRLTLEFSANPAWYAVQALPTLSNPGNDNAVNWFASYYVNTLGTFIPKQYPRVGAMIQAWKQQGGTKETLFSALQKNEELKNVLLQETPWVLDAKDETEQKQSLSLLFDLNRSQSLTSTATKKLADLQTEKGGWSWFKGFYPSRSITQYILYGFAQLTNLNAVEYGDDVKQMQVKALNYLDVEIANDFANLKKYDKNWAALKSISINQLEYLYVRSDYRDIPVSKEAREAEKFYTSVVEKNWTSLGLYPQSLLAVLAKKNGNKLLADKIMASIREHATTTDEMGMYWANNKSSVFFSQSAVAVHTFLMDAFKENGASALEMDNLKLWLLKQKQTQQWESTHGTLSAIYALLSNGSDWLASKGEVDIRLGNVQVDTSDKELGTGYTKQSWEKDAVRPDMGKVTVTKKDNGPAYGAVYWQYLENLDKIQGQSNKELNLTKMLFKEISSEKGKVLQPITEGSDLKVGDKVVVRLVVRADRDMEFVQLKDMRASCFEPVDQTSGVQWNGGTIYYRTSRDASTNFYFDFLPKGTYTFEYGVYVARSGEYKNGISSIQCLYAPEFVSHTEGITASPRRIQ